IDCKSIRAESGPSPDEKKGTPLMGDVAARILDLAGIVLNRNTIPGDKSARNPSGVRLGTPWITQRGFKTAEIKRLAVVIADLLKAMEPYAFAGRFGPVYRAKVDFEVLEKTKWDVVDLACCADLPADYSPSGYPHHFFMYKPTKDKGGDWDIIEIEGPHARGFCNVAMTNDVYALAAGESQPTWILEPNGNPMSSGLLKRPSQESTCFRLLVPKDKESRVAHWLRALSDGYVNIDEEDIYVKNTGPVAVRRLPHTLAEEWDSRPPAIESFDKEDVGWAFHKPYWIGQRARANAPGGLELLPPFSWAEPDNARLKKTVLNEVHRQAGARLVSFAGWEMPVRFSSVQQEHLAVRNAAGIFDISHMGLFEFTGDNVHLFLNVITTNDISMLEPGKSHYSYLLNPDGKVIDDIWVYQLGKQHYWMVVNAANVDKDWEWINAVREGRVLIDTERPWSCALGTENIIIRNLREEQAQLALQGPKSTEILLSLVEPDDPLYEMIEDMKRTEIIHGSIDGYDVYLARTGYTGEPRSYEIFVHPKAAAAFWHTLIKVGEPFGLCPIGLGARDSLRIEAGLPLYGHELAGPMDLNPADAGFSSYVKLYKPFFVGKAAFVEHELDRKAKLIRFRIDEERSRVPEQGDVIVNRKGRVVGAVTSSSIDSEGRLTGLGYVRTPYNKTGMRLAVFQSSSHEWSSKPLSSLKTGDRVQMHDDITVIKRFLNKKD
ncbi:MAG: glycine cleavage system aminomethyltransferase GcvT, partial [Anaerolineales bacterium]|nr:glycine cleavage system aminomethyltransferase GcvT [Anaerolineales bacterium]